MSLAAAALLIERLGFLLTMMALFFFLLRVLGRYSLIVTGASAVTGSLGIYFVFERWLHVPLPKGLLGP